MFVLEDLLIVTDLLMVLDATLFAVFALFAALFVSPAALLVAARVRGSAHPGLSPVVLPPLLPGFTSDGNSHCRGCCHDCFQSPGMMLDAMRRDFLLWAYLLAAMSFSVFEGAETKLPDHDAENDARDDAFVVGAGSGVENEFSFTVSETSGPGAETELCDHDMDLGSRGQVRCHAHPVGIGHAPLFPKTKEDKEFSLEFFGNVSRNVESRGASGRIFESDVIDGAFSTLVDFDNVGSSGSCTAACTEAAFVPSGCSSGKGFCGKDTRGKTEDVKLVQFFVNRGTGSVTVVRCSSDTVLSEVLHLDVDEYALCGSRFAKVGCTIGENSIGNCSNVQVLRRLRGGAGVHLDIPGQWECKVCGATRCWPARKRCYKCDAPRDTVPNNLPMGPLGRAPPQSRSSGPPTRSSGPRHVPPRDSGTAGAGVGPSPGGVEAEKKVEASEMLQALSLLQRIMTPEDFVKYQVLVAPKPKPGKTREQELADRVKSLHRLRTQETTHRGQIDKLEFDLQRHRDMLQGVLSRIRVESDECDELRAQVAKEQAPPENCGTIPPTQSDSQPDDMYLSTVEEENGDESMLMGASTGAEDDLDVGRDNGIWERRRNAIIKNNRMVKLKDKDKLKVKPCKTIIIEEEPPPAPPDSGKQLAEVIARLSQDEIGLSLVTYRPPLCRILGTIYWFATVFGCIFWGLYCKVCVAFLPGKFSQL